MQLDCSDSKVKVLHAIVTFESCRYVTGSSETVRLERGCKMAKPLIVELPLERNGSDETRQSLQAT